MMRKSRKSVYYDLFSPVNTPVNIENALYVIDGGFLIYRVAWELREKFSSIMNKCVEYVKKYFGEQSIIVFDGYPDELTERSTKSAERRRRINKYIAATVEFDETMLLTMPKEKFLSNEGNKKRLISMLAEKLADKNIKVKQAAEDADTTIVNTAIKAASRTDCVVVVGEDIDLLVILTAFAPDSNQLFMMKPGKGKSETVFYSPVISKMSTKAKENILFLHAFSGCDSTSAIFRQGKMKLVKLLDKDADVQKAVNVFNNPRAAADEVSSAGVKIIAALYTGSSLESCTLNEIRFAMFKKSLVQKTFNLAAIPPTEEAASLHSWRAFLQINLCKDYILGTRLSEVGKLQNMGCYRSLLQPNRPHNNYSTVQHVNVRRDAEMLAVARSKA